MSDLPLIKAAKLWEKVSARTGQTYFVGRWGGCRVLIFENQERQGEGETTHWLLLVAAEPYQQPRDGQASEPAAVAEPSLGQGNSRSRMALRKALGSLRSASGGSTLLSLSSGRGTSGLGFRRPTASRSRTTISRTSGGSRWTRWYD